MINVLAFEEKNQIEIERSYVTAFQVFPGIHVLKNVHTCIGRVVCLFSFSSFSVNIRKNNLKIIFLPCSLIIICKSS